jgi:hypothetical protein
MVNNLDNPKKECMLFANQDKVKRIAKDNNASWTEK